MSDFRKKMAEFCRKRAKNTAFARENTRFHAKMGVFRAEKRFFAKFSGEKASPPRRKRRGERPKSVPHIKSVREASGTLFTKTSNNFVPGKIVGRSVGRSLRKIRYILVHSESFHTFFFYAVFVFP